MSQVLRNINPLVRIRLAPLYNCKDDSTSLHLAHSRARGRGTVSRHSATTTTTRSSLPPSPAHRDTPQVLVLSAMVGVVQCAMGMLGMGVLASFLSDAVLSGFTNAAAILVSTSQVWGGVGVT